MDNYFLLFNTSTGLPGKVSCGGHSAENCGKCGNNAGMCNGDCTWKNKRCIFHCREFNRYIFHFQGADFNWRIGAKAGLNIHNNGGGYYRRSK